MTQSAHDDQFITAEQATGCSVAADPTQERTGHTAAEQAMYWRGFEEAQANAQHNAKVRSIPTGATGDAQMAGDLMPKLQSLLDRMASDPRTGAMFEADGDTLRDAMHLCRSVKVCAAIGAPAAGDALDKARLDWLEQHDGRFYNKDRISSIVDVGFLVAGDLTGIRHQSVRAAIDAAIAQQSQRKEA